MKLQLDEGNGQYRIRACHADGIQVNELLLRRSCIVSPARLIADWGPRRLAEVDRSALEPALALKPEILLLGSGTRTRFPAPALLHEIQSRGIGFEVMDTAAACRCYSVLMAENRRVVAALLMPDVRD